MPNGSIKLNNFKYITPQRKFIKNSMESLIHHFKLYSEGFKERVCELCGQDETWNGKKISLILDHINGVNTDNRIENLRSATYSENNRNAKRREDSKSGVKNVSWYPNAQKWAVRIYLEGKNKYFGLYDTKEEAETVAKLNRELIYGDFARDY
jgi:hypothetical protein